MREKIRDIMRSIVECELQTEAKTLQDATYIDQKLLISSLFNSDQPYSVGTIMLRLVVIDSLYSTNAAYSYFSFEEMAENIYIKLGQNEKSAREYFNSLVHDGKDDKNLFREAYGIQKNLSEGAKQMSLLSKYAYYSLYLQDEYPLGFPIYDSLALESYPTVCKMLGIPQITHIDEDITQYIKALNEVRKVLFDNNETFDGIQQYDILDAYLWRMGKFSGGNLSLLLGREDYITFVKNIGLQAKKLECKNEKFKESDADYKQRMIQNSAVGVTTDSKSHTSFDFNQAVVEKLSQEGCNPFVGIKVYDNYLNKLLNHWRQFIQFKTHSAKYQREAKPLATSVNNDPISQIADFADFEIYHIVQCETGKIIIYNEQEPLPNVIATLRQIANKIHFDYSESWNTQQFGAKLIKYINTNNFNKQ